MMNPYQDQYIPNIEPRTGISVPDQSYNLYAGGKVVLKDVKEYMFDYTPGATTTGPRFQDLYEILPDTGYLMNQTTFRYGSRHSAPVRITTTGSNGEQVDTYRYTVADLETAGTNQVLQGMITNNVFAPVLKEQVFLTRENSTSLISEKVVQHGTGNLDGKTVYFPVREYNLALDEPQMVASLPSTSSFNYIVPQGGNNYSVTELVHDKRGKTYRVEETHAPGEITAIVHDNSNGKPVLEAHGTRRSGVDAMDRYRVLEITSRQYDLSYSGRALLYFPGQEDVMSVFNEFLDETAQVENQVNVFNDAFLQEEVHQAMKYYAEFFLYMYNDPWFTVQRDTILAHQHSLIKEYTDFCDRNVGNLAFFYNEYLYLVECVLNYARYFTSERMDEFKFNVNRDLTGQNMGSTLKVIPPDDHLVYNLYYVASSSQGQSGTFNCKAIYNDGSYYTFSKSFTIASSNWKVNLLRLDLNEVPGKENIASFEVYFPYSIALTVLVPEGTEFEAVSYNQLGRVFCKLNHLQQLERYEYDGLGRVIKVFDAYGNLRQEFKYNEVATIN
jgi:YD repeat-containing protein